MLKGEQATFWYKQSTLVVVWLSYLPLDPRFKPGQGRWIFFLDRKNPEYGSCVIDLQHIKEPQAEIRASEQNLSAFSRSL